ncbi:glutamate-5-semialdehyde dehydrogenase [Proteiniborus sp. MB09-C3]|uniref:glutamate-5-semialdehyde dehydrogenase n=1 Tax=Proteiniborus sp. MB09-C3 TaxID=3050072 RepID=UPI00255718EC|nr:glutamate-5-semialdehyde dehydrogenase [Proteiniborus sp. MB09-C3]WIV12336.1 glutamate-5-semialdehyde dehydrogenase [Proteiniborus sp. MB09-C3]
MPEDITYTAKINSRKFALVEGELRSRILVKMAENIVAKKNQILLANKQDIDIAYRNKLDESRLSILTLNEKSIEAMGESLKRMSRLIDPVGERISYVMKKDGLIIEKKQVPLGVISVVYEARPDVVTDSVGICVRTGNSVILAGSRHSTNTDKCISEILRDTLNEFGICPDNIQYLFDCSHKSKIALSRQNRFVDLMVVRGGVEAVEVLREHALVPIIVAGEGNCHIYIAEDAFFDMACDIVINSKVPRPKACNAAETVLVHKDWSSQYFTDFITKLLKNNIEIFGCEKSVQLHPSIKLADEHHFEHEFFAPAIAVKIVENIDEAINHINKYRTPHTETIISNNLENVSYFMNYVEANVICHNASTRLTDGIEFGLGSEIGISTQKFHVGGPIGIYHLMQQKYFLSGNGNLRY